MKKKFTLLIAVLMTWIGFSASAAVGDVFSTSYLYYKILTDEEGNRTVEISSTPSGYGTSSNVIDRTKGLQNVNTVTYDGKTYDVVAIGENAFEGKYFKTEVTYFPTSITYIKANAFKNVNGYCFRIFGAAFDPRAFIGNKLKSGVQVTNSTIYSAENNIPYDNTTHALLVFPGRKTQTTGVNATDYYTSYTIPSTYWGVGEYAFASNSMLTSVTTNSSMTFINAHAFDGSVLQTINMVSGSNPFTIGEKAFYNCTALSNVTIPSNCTAIASDAFEGCSAITSLTVNCNLTDDMANVVFDDAVYAALKGHVTFGDGVDVSAYESNANWGRFFDVPDRNVYILGDVNGNSWSTTHGVQMTTTDNIIYTATITTEKADENGNPANFFDFTTALTENEDDWDNIVQYRFGPVAEGENFLVTKATLDQDLTLTPRLDGGKNFQITQGTWNLTLNLNAMTVKIEKVMPDVWVMGTVNGNAWAANVGDKMTWDNANKQYTIEVEVTDDWGYFGFTTALGANADDWGSIAGNRLGAVSSGDFEVTADMVHNAQSLSLTYSSNPNAFKIPAGTFTLTISDFDEDTRNLVITGNLASELDTTPFSVGKFKYRRLNNDGEVEMLGYNEENATASLVKANFSGLSTITYEGETYRIVSIAEEAFAGHGLAGSFTIEPMTYLREIKKGAFRNVGVPCGNNALARPFGLPSSLETIGEEAFAGSAVSTLTIPASVTSIGNGVVAGCRRLSSISVASGNSAYKAVGGDIYTLNGSTLVAAAPQKATLTVAEGCQTIAPKAVMNIPETTVDENGQSITGAVIMRNLVLPSTLTTIGENAFAGSKTFTSVTCNAVNPPAGGVFDNAVYLACANKLVVPEGSEAAYRADENWGNFYQPTYAVTVNEAEHGTVVANKAEAMEGETVTLTVNPATGFELGTLTVMNGETEVEVTNLTFVMPAAPVTVTAVFTAINYAVTVAETEHGTVISDKATANMGETVTLTATPAEGYVLDAITVMNGETAVETTATESGATFVMPAAPVTVTATFAEIPTFTITVAEVEHGTIEADKTEAEEGETVTLTVTPNEGYELGTLTVMNGETEIEVTNLTFVMPAAPVTVTATFTAIDYTITVAQTENGTVEAPATANYGETVNLTVTPVVGYELATLTYTVEGVEPVNIENNAFTMPSAPVTINATFAAIDYAITVAETENGTVEAPATANYGETVMLTVTPNEGYELATLTYTVENAEPVNIENNQFIMPAAPVTINATFELLPVQLDGIVFAGNTYASWYGDTNMAVPEGMTAYVVTGIENDVCLIEAVDYIPANVGVLLYSTTSAESVSTVPYTGEPTTVTSMLQGTLVEMEMTNGYVLYNDSFVRTMLGTLAAHRCYLPVPANAAGAPMRLRIVRNDDVVTAINDVRVAGDGNVRYIDINGRMSDKPFQGVNIVVNADGTVIKIVK